MSHPTTNTCRYCHGTNREFCICGSDQRPAGFTGWTAVWGAASAPSSAATTSRSIIMSRVRITDEGRRLLQAHDAMAETRRVERPRLESRPLPEGWRRDGDTMRHGLYPFAIRVEVADDIERHLAEQRSLLALLEWLAHDRAVRAQGKP